MFSFAASCAATGRLRRRTPVSRSTLIACLSALTFPIGSHAEDTVVVTANRTPQPVSRVLADVSIVDRESIERSGATAVADLLARLPGIEFARNGGPGTATSVFIRGAETRHTAVYIDGVRVESQSTGGAVWEQIPLEQIERIEVLRGPAAALYGSDAVAGVVQLFTRRGQGALRPAVSLSTGSYATRQVQAGLSGSTDGFDYSLSGTHGRSNGFSTRAAAITSVNPDDDGWRRNSVHARVGYQFNTVHRVDVSLLGSNLRSQYDGFTLGLDDVNDYTLRTGSVRWQGRWSEATNTRLQLGQTLSTYESKPDFYRTETTLRNYVLQHDQHIGNSLLTATLERREDELMNPATPFTAHLKSDRHQNSAGLGWNGDFGEHLLQAQVRHDDDSEFRGKSTGSVAWGWRFAPQWRVTAAAATSFRVPTLYQRFSPYGNAALVPETGRNLETGLRWANEGSELSVTGWRNRVTNLISFGAAGPCRDAFGCYVNVGRAQLEGVTLAGRTRLAGVTLRGSFDWHDPRNLAKLKLLERRATRFASLGADANVSGWTLGTELQAAGARFEDAANTQRLGGYGLVNVFASKTLTSGLALEGRIDNVGDKDYQLAQTFATAGRTVQVTLRWTMR